MVLMLLVVACYTVCGLSDKYSVAKLKFDGNSFTFLMALPTAVLLLPLMPFSDMHLQLCWQSVLAPFVHPIRMIKDKPKGCAFVALTKIPNALGLVLENAVIATSMTNYSFIQPMIMVALFFIGLIRKESTKPLNIIGSIVCISGIAAFQIFGLI